MKFQIGDIVKTVQVPISDDSRMFVSIVVALPETVETLWQGNYRCLVIHSKNFHTKAGMFAWCGLDGCEFDGNGKQIWKSEKL